LFIHRLSYRIKSSYVLIETVKRKTFLTAFVILAGLHLALVCASRLYPFTDLPNHLAAATIYRYFGEPTNRFAEFFALDTFLKPNVFHMLFCSLDIFPSVEFANRMFFCLYVVLLPLSVLLVIRKLQGNPWFSLLSFLLLYNYNTSWGFVGFTFSIPLLMFTFSATIDHLESRRTMSGVVVASLLVLLFFVHVLAALFSLLIVLIAALCRRGRPIIGRIAQCAVVVPVTALLILWWRTETATYRGPGVGEFMLHYYRNDYTETMLNRGGILVYDNYHLSEGFQGYALALVFSLCIIIPTFLVWLQWRRSPQASSSVQARKWAPLLFGLSLICCLLLPHEIPQQSILYQRFSSILLISLVVAGGAFAPREIHLSKRMGTLAICILHFILWAHCFTEFNRENRHFTASFFPENSRNQTLAGLIYDYTFRGRPTYIHAPGYFITWKQGIATTRIVDYRYGTVRRKVGGSPFPAYLEWVGRLDNYDGRYNDMDYILVRGTPTDAAAPYVERLKSVVTGNEWSLYEKPAPPTMQHPR